MMQKTDNKNTRSKGTQRVPVNFGGKLTYSQGARKMESNERFGGNLRQGAEGEDVVREKKECRDARVSAESQQRTATAESEKGLIPKGKYGEAQAKTGTVSGTEDRYPKENAESEGGLEGDRVRAKSALGELEPIGDTHIAFRYCEDREAREALAYVFSVLPERVRGEIAALAEREDGFAERLTEVTLRADGMCTVRVGGRQKCLHTRIGRVEVDSVLRGMTRGALYAHANQICCGYLTPYRGVRVGVAGEATVKEGRIESVHTVSTLVFRIPHGNLSGESELGALYRKEVRRGWLLLSAPGVGKTSALRALCRALSGGSSPLHVVAVDERREFLPSDHEGRTLDTLRGYERGVGMEIALRTLGAEVLVMDEIGTRNDAEGIERHLLSGIPIVASAHGASVWEVMRRPMLSRMLSLRAFDVISAIRAVPNGVVLSNYRLK